MNTSRSLSSDELWRAGRARRRRRQFALAVVTAAVLGTGTGGYAMTRPHRPSSLAVVSEPSPTLGPTSSATPRPPAFAFITTDHNDATRTNYFLLHYAHLAGAVRKVEIEDESGSWTYVPDKCVEQGEGDLHFQRTYPRDGRYHLRLAITYGKCDADDVAWKTAFLNADTPVGPIDAGPA
jgi:hypothetical protein